jgi:hypothetical protein
VNPAE